MAQVINTNVSSLNAQRNLNTSQSALATSLQRLSSGLRINSAKDDAAGLAISSRMTTQINGNTQAARNANDGISLAQTAEGALGEIGENLQRMRVLAVQSANATNSASDRAALQKEVAQLAAEIDRVALQTSFNGAKLLDGSFTLQKFQVGANVGETIDVAQIDSARTGTLGQRYTATVTGSAVSGAADATIDLSALSINGKAIASAAGTAADGKAIAAAINNAGITGVSAKASATTVAGSTMTAANLTGTITINGVTTASITTTTNAAESRGLVISAVNAISASTGVVATESGGTVVLTAADGRNITHSLTTLTEAATGLGTAGTSKSAVTVDYQGEKGQALVISGTVGTSGLTAAPTNVQLTGTAVSLLDISTVNGANEALKSIDAALTSVNTSRADLGAIQNRFASTVTNLQTMSENISASRSRILDADFAAETAALTRNQILQQAGVAMLSQANALPQNVLSLLK